VSLIQKIATLVRAIGVRSAYLSPWWLAPAFLFLVSVAVTQPATTGDTFVYCSSVVEVLRHAAPSSILWEPGHILWRPLAYFCSPLFFGLIPDRLAWTPALKIGYGLTAVNLICGMLATVLIYDLSRRLARNEAAAMIPAMLFVWGNGVLNYSQAGTSYVAGMFFLIAGLWWQITARRSSGMTVVGPAVFFGIAALFWLPYVLAVPAACCARRFLATKEEARRCVSWRQVFLAALTAGATIASGLGLATIRAGIRSFPQWVAWLVSAGHEMRQTRRAIRAIPGCSRLFLDLGSDGIYLKRFLFHDPYHPVSILGLIAHSGWKPALFYAFIGAVLLLAWRSESGRRALVTLVLAGAPTLAAAIFVFEPSSPERLFPLLPFLLWTIAAAWQTPKPMAAQWMLCLFIALLPVVNGPAFLTGISGWRQEAARRAAEFHTAAARGDALVGIVITEPIIDVPAELYGSLNRDGAILHRTWAVDVINAHATQWPSRVAQFMLSNCTEGRATWVEKAGLASTPADRLVWVEGDNPQIHWGDVPAFFRTFEYDRDSGGKDGFVRIACSASNKERLRNFTSAK